MQHNPSLLDFEHVPRLVSIFQHVADTFEPSWIAVPGPNYKRVIILEPPRYFKSEVASRLFPAYLLRRFSRLNVGIVSYSASLAWELSSDARDYYEAAGGMHRQDTKAKRRWSTTAGGGLWAEGEGGSMLGKGYDFVSLDDPQDPTHAHSPTYQRRFEHWWPQKFYSRREPGAAICLVMQRLALEDACGWLFKREAEHPQYWLVVCCDAVRSDEPFASYGGPGGLPLTCTLEPDPRTLGTILAPSRFSQSDVEETCIGSDSFTWDAQQQQRPGAVTGDFWNEEWFQIHDELPENAYSGGRDWDTAYGKNRANSASATIESYRGPDLKDADGNARRDKSGNPLFMIYVEDCAWDWLEMPELVYWMGGPKPQTSDVAAIEPLDGPHYIEAKASGKSIKQTLDDNGVPCREVPVTGGDKFARAQSAQPRVSRGLVSVNRTIVDRLLRGSRQGLLRVTAEGLQASGTDLDLNDVFVQVINRHLSYREVVYIL